MKFNYKALKGIGSMSLFIKQAGLISVLLFVGLSSHTTLAKSIFIPNFGFESGLRGWSPKGSAKPSNSVKRKGDFSAKLSAEDAEIGRKVEVKPNTNYEFSAFIQGNAVLGAQVGDNAYTSSLGKPSGWKKLSFVFNSGDNDFIIVFAKYKDQIGYIDNVKLKTTSVNAVKTLVVKKAPSTLPPPSSNFELIDWALSVPTDDDENGKADTIKEIALSEGYSNSKYFYTNDKGAMVFKVPVGGFKTSKNTKFTRVELREMLRKGNTEHKTKGVGKNNWVFSSAPEEDQIAAGAVNGKLTGTLSVNHVTTTGEPKQVGRVVFAQIHATNDEPIRLYYRKLPNNEKGSIYFAHEPLGEKDIYFEMVGSKSSNAENPEDGIALGEKFSYEIDVNGNGMMVKLFREGKVTISKAVDMSQSGYDQSGQYMYFKAGAYIQDSTGEANDYAEVVYYELDNSH